MGGAAFVLGMVPTMCRDLSPRRSALLEVGLPGLGRSVSADAVCLFLPGCLSRARVDDKPLRASCSSLSVAAAAAVCVPRFAKRIGSEAKRSVTLARCSALLCSFHLPAPSFRGMVLILPAAILSAAPSSSPAASPCAAPLTPSQNPPGAIFPSAASASIGYLSRARDSRVRVLDAFSRSGCCSGDSFSPADSGCAGSRPLQGRWLPLLGLPLGRRGSRRPLRVGSGAGDGGPKLGDSRATGRRSPGPGLGLIPRLGRASGRCTFSGSAADGRQVRAEPSWEGSAEPRRGVLAARAASRGRSAPRSRLWRALRAFGAVSVSPAPKRKAPFCGASLVRLRLPLPFSWLRHLGPFGPSSSIRGAENVWSSRFCRPSDGSSFAA